MGLSHMPSEILLITTAHLTDPCDLLALRLTSTLFNALLSERFSTTFPRHLYKRNNQYVRVDTMLFWVAEHNHMRFFRKISIKEAWPRSPSNPALGALRQAAMNAVRHGNEQMMVKIIDYTVYTYSMANHEDILGECFEVALAEDQIEIAKRLIDSGVKPSWANLGADWVLVQLAIEAHHIDLVEYMLRDNAEAVLDWDGEDIGAIKESLRLYINTRRYNSTSTWCQRTLHMLLARQDMFDRPLDWDFFLGLIELWLERRNCGPECDVWFGENRRLDQEEMLLELRKVERGEYAQGVIS